MNGQQVGAGNNPKVASLVAAKPRLGRQAGTLEEPAFDSEGIAAMAFSSINTNNSAAIALQSLNSTNNMLETTQKRVSTGFRVADARDDGGAFAVAQRVRGEISGLTSANEQLARPRACWTPRCRA